MEYHIADRGNRHATDALHRRGRPSPHRPTQVVEVRQAHLTFHRNEATLAEVLTVTGWRIHVSNVPTETMPLDQAIAYYRGE
ncbi:MAG: hypothetical protein AAGB97_07820 [Dehalococcoidia bacterium]